MTLHELYLDVKQQVAAAVSAVNQATISAAVYTEQLITDALAAVHALDAYLDYFGLVGDPIDVAVDLLIDQLFNLAKALDNRGYYAIYQQTFSAANQYQAAKSAYSGFVGGLGGTSGGGGASGSWGEELPLKSYPWYQCFNRQNTKRHSLSASTPPPEDAIDFTILLGPCSDIFVYADKNPDGYWGAGIYQYARLRIWVRFVDIDVIFDYDWNESPAYPNYSLGYSYIINNQSHEQYFQASYNIADWTGVYYNHPVILWPYDTSDRILTRNGDAIRDVNWEVIGRLSKWEHEYWLYNLRYWEVWACRGIPDGLGGFYSCGQPAQLQFINPCNVPPGKDFPVTPIPIPIPIPILTDDRLRQKVVKMLRLGVTLRPYDIMCYGQKILCDGEQIICGGV